MITFEANMYNFLIFGTKQRVHGIISQPFFLKKKEKRLNGEAAII